MKTYFDQNRVVRPTDRRWHAADLEYCGLRLLTVPAMAAKLAPNVAVGAWGRNEQQLAQLAREAREEGRGLDVRRLQTQRWWNAQWRQEGGLYGVDRLTRDEYALSEALLGPNGLPPDAFPRLDGPVEEHNDAQILAQVVARGGTMLITSDSEFVDEVELARWRREEGSAWRLRVEHVVYDADALYTGWAMHPGIGDRFVRTALGAYWPAEAGAGVNRIRESVHAGVEGLRKGHMPRLARHLATQLERRRDVLELIEKVRRRLPEKMRRGEEELRRMREIGSAGQPRQGPQQAPAAPWPAPVGYER